MAWGLKTPAIFGMFYPHGEMTGHDEVLRDYYDNKMPASEKAAFESFFDYHRETVWRHTSDRGPLASHEMPKEYQLKKSYRSLAALMEINGTFLIVQKPLKELIEAFEPGVHQFWPITIALRGGQPYPVPCFGMVIKNHIESVLADQSEWTPSHSRPPLRYMTQDFFDAEKHRVDRVVLSQKAIEGRHLWRDTRWLKPGLFISNELHDAVKAAGLRIFPTRQAKEV